jgi:hypothetical protein
MLIAPISGSGAEQIFRSTLKGDLPRSTKALFLLYKQVVSSYKVHGFSHFCNNLFIFKRFSDLVALFTL